MLQSVFPPNPTGRYLAALLEYIPHIYPFNTGEATDIHGGQLDLTLVSRDLSPGATWQVPPTLTSDHYVTLTTLTVAQPAFPLEGPIGPDSKQP